MKRPLVAANWKMNLTRAEATALAASYRALANTTPGVDIALFPTALHLADIARGGLPIKNFFPGAQNAHWEKSGAFTGETSPWQIKDIGATHVLIGHSERREMFGESDDILARKLAAVGEAGLCPVFCLGETLEQREEEETFSILRRQLSVLETLTPAVKGRVTIAYEPVWAIGTGINAAPAQVADVHAFLRSVLDAMGNLGEARILYGGSVKPENAGALSGQANVDGFLVGGASLTEQSFRAIVEGVAVQR